MKIIGIYNVDSDMVSKIKYMTSRVLKVSDCALCDITNGWHPLGKPQWRQEQKLTPEFITLHKDQQTPEMRLVTDGLTPCVLVLQDEQFRIIMTKEDLLSCAGDLQVLIANIRLHLAKSS